MNFKTILEESDQPPNKSEIHIPENKWKFAVEMQRANLVEGKEITMETDKGTFAGRLVCEMFDSHKYRPTSYTWLGYTDNAKKGIQEVGIPHKALFQHTAIFGNSGYGKSTVVKNMLLQWIQAGYGMCFIDPKGTDSPKLLRTIPEHRKKDIVWVEPGSTSHRETVGFNILQTGAEPGTQEQESEADSIIEELLGIFEAICVEWSPQIKVFATTVLFQMICAEQEYTLIDFYRVLDSPAEREAFIEVYGDELGGMDREIIESIEPEDIQPLTQKLTEIIARPLTRELLATKDSNANIPDLIDERKIIICNFSSIAEDSLEFLSAAVVRRVWSHIKTRKNIPASERVPFFLCLDEFDDQTKDFPDSPDMMDIGEVISQCRAFKLSVLLANQNPTQLADDIKQKVYGNCNNKFTFNQGNFQDAGDLAQGIKDLDGQQIMELSEYRLMGKLTINGNKTGGLVINTFAEYPPLRTVEAGLKIITQSVQTYGVRHPNSEFDESEYGIIANITQSTEERLRQGDETVTQAHVLTTLESAKMNPETPSKDGYAAETGLERIITSHCTDFEYGEVKSTLLTPQLNTLYTEQTDSSGRAYYTHTKEGIDALEAEYPETTRPLSLFALKYLSSIGYFVSPPTTEDIQGEYEFEAIPPIKPTKQASTLKIARRLESTMEKAYPQIHENFADQNLKISVLSNPLSAPENVIKALVMLEEGEHCVYVVPEHISDDIEGYDALKQLLVGSETAPPLISDSRGTDEILYNTLRPLTLSDESYPVRDHSRSTQWVRHDDDSISLKNADSEESIVTYDSEEELSTSSVGTDFEQYLLQVDDSFELYKTHQTGSDTRIATYDSLEELQSDGYQYITQPLIPENVWPTTESPDPSRWSCLSIPNSGGKARLLRPGST